MTAALEIQNKHLVCVIVPECGAAVTSLALVKKSVTTNILVPTPPELVIPGAFDPRLFSLTHIAPWGGAIRNNTFKWNGKPRTVTPNLPDVPLFTHGIGWLSAWTGKKDGRHSASCRLNHKANEIWPFDFTLTTVFDLEEDNLVISYELTNESRSGTMPTGLGTRMRLPRGRNTLLSAGISSLWLEDENYVPLTMGEVPFNIDLKEGIKLDAVNTRERWFNGWTRRLSIDYAESRMSVTIKADDEMRHLGFSCSGNNHHFTLTPMTHVPGAMDIRGYDEDETGFREIGPGESFETKIKIDVELA